MFGCFKHSLTLTVILVTAGQTTAQDNEWLSHGPYGGSVLTIAINPLDNNEIFLGTVHNYLYRSTDRGESWSNMGGGFINASMREIAIHPFGPDTMYVGTAQGFYKSTDAGQTWNLILMPRRGPNEYRSVVILPFDPSIVMTGGPWFDKWRSTDGGQTWTEMEIPFETGLQRIIVCPTDSAYIYIVGETPSHCVYRSPDWGETWEVIQSNIDSTSSSSDLAVDPVDTRVLYLARWDFLETGGQILLKSTNRGASWTDISPEGLTNRRIMDVEVCPYQHNTVFIATYSDGVWMSSDGGESWSPRNNGLGGDLEPAVIKFDASNRLMYLGVFYNGIYRSEDLGESWENISQNINAKECLSIAVSSAGQPSILVSSMIQFSKSTDWGATWQDVDLGMNPFERVMHVQYDAYTQGRVFAATTSTDPRWDQSNFFLSTDGGYSWEARSDGIPPDVWLSNFDIIYESGQPGRILLPSNHGLYYSDDVGQAWAHCDECLFPNGDYMQVKVSPLNPDIVAASIYRDDLVYSLDGAQTWHQASPLPSDESSHIIDMEFSGVDETTLYVSVTRMGLFKTTDMGEAWIDITGDIPRANYFVISDIEMNPENPQNILIHDSFHGIYQSHDAGGNWEPLYPILDTTIALGFIAFVPGDTSRIFFASRGHSVLSLHRTTTGIDEEPPSPVTFSLSKPWPNPFNAATRIAFTIPAAAPVIVDIFDILGKRVERLADGEIMPGGRNELTWDAGELSSGIYFIRVTAGESSATQKALLLR